MGVFALTQRMSKSMAKAVCSSVLMVGLVLATCLHGSPDTVRILTDEEWFADIGQAEKAIRKTHFKPFHELDEAEFNAAISGLRARVPELSDDEIIIGLARVVALLRDGHTRLHLPRQFPELALEAELGHSGTPPPRHEGLRFHQLPVRFGLFSDGLYVTAASSEYARLVGAKVVRIGALTAESAIAQTRAVSFFENDSRAKLMAPDRLALPEVLRALKITNSIDTIGIVTSDSLGRVRETNLATLSAPPAEWIDGMASPAPLWMRDQETSQWFEALPSSDVIYVQVNRFEESPPRPYSEFVAETLAAARDAGVSKYVLDLRHNSGGAGTWTLPFIRGLVQSEFNRYGRLYVLIGRTTFSASELLLHQLEALSYSIFVGEASGAKPSHFGDAKRVVLDNSGLTLRVSTIYWQSWIANDFRDAITPHIKATISSADWFKGHDPALEAAISYGAPTGLAAQMEALFREGENQNALLLYQRYETDPSYPELRSAIPELIAMADHLIEDQIIRPGYFVFILLNRTYPGIPEVEAGLARAEELARQQADR
jgi:hypothetical protein